MRYIPSEKLEIIRIVEDSELSIRQTLKELSIHRSTFYNWYRRYLEDGGRAWGPKSARLGPYATRFRRKSKSRLFVRLWNKRISHTEN